jgi:cytochrome d ubiquinol oxidase subunit II
MVELWFAILCLMITFFVVLDGWDIGAGALHFIVAKNLEERRIVIAALGPLWSWHEVWLVAAGGVLFIAFPRVLATAFSEYYLALFLVLWCLILRGISLEFRSHIADSFWRSFWDWVFAAANVLLAILFGTALGNVIRGMPLAPDTSVSLPFFTHFGVRGDVGLLDWYTLSVAIFALICLAAHGASFLSLKTEDQVRRRSQVAARRLWLATAFFLLVVTVETMSVRPQLFANISGRPLAWITILLLVSAWIAIVTGFQPASDLRVFLGGCGVIVGLLGTAAVTLFPEMLHSSGSPAVSITAYNGSSDPNNLRIAAYWWPAAFVLSLVYFAFIGKYYRGRVQLSRDTQRPY